MGFVTFSMPQEIVLSFIQGGKIVNFIETGTFRGGTTFWAAQHFENVYTIEIDPEISKQTSSRNDCPRNIQFFVGDSKTKLLEVLEQVEGRSLYWLDGHWCGVSNFGVETECPLMQELVAISDRKDDVILVDDARLFLGPPLPPHNNTLWPRIDEIICYLKSVFPNNLVTICDDVIFCVPPDLIYLFDINWQKYFYNRFSRKKTILQKIKIVLKKYLNGQQK
jgi:hypothetical protein